MAIAFDNAVALTGTGSPVSGPFTLAAGATLILVGIATNGDGDVSTGVTYGGQALTLAGKGQYFSANEYWYIYYKFAPLTGANTLSYTKSGGSNTNTVRAVSYTGTATTGAFNIVDNTGSSSPATSTLTTALANSWTALWALNVDGNWTASTGSTARGTANTFQWFDSNASQGVPGSKSMALTYSGSRTWHGLMVEIPLPYTQALGELATGNMTAYYKMFGLYDSSGNNKTLTNGGSVTFVAPGRIGGTSASLNGTSQYLQTPASLTSSVGTLSLWFKTTSTTADQMMFDNTTSGVSDYIMVRAEFNSNRYRYVIQDDALFDTTSPRDTNWHNIILAWDASTAWKAYFDGILASTGSGVKSASSTNASFIGVQGNGSSSAATRYFDGKIDEVIIWPYRFTDAQARRYFNYSKGRMSPSRRNSM